MNNLFAQRLGRKTEIQDRFRFITTVSQLSHFDMIYVYHHISEGTMLDLTLETKHLNGDLLYKVMYRHYHLGFVRISNFLKYEYTNTESLTAKVFSLSKEKYLPTKSLDISIEPNNMKLVS